MSTTRYKDPIPEDVCIFTTLDEAAKIQTAHPYAIFYPENNGHYAKNLDGTVVAVASDEMFATTDAATTRFYIPLLKGATVVDTDHDLPEFTAAYLHVNLETTIGGYTINEPNGLILAYIEDNPSKEMDK
ncbi:hypothetical protein BDV36DRAFT_298644 [Aspergillus pseudocaelatus]|uniref:Uncharacterized protein n=1 Tax=Aspergillus pseudocaelatus TaxID=1825620 RepID=A0ABQ6WCC6_9EURO|nr:hypothetical protein BDV36DRAFT_298644 [Aspergillus pseudocaelatus]